MQDGPPARGLHARPGQTGQRGEREERPEAPGLRSAEQGRAAHPEPAHEDDPLAEAIGREAPKGSG